MFIFRTPFKIHLYCCLLVLLAALNVEANQRALTLACSPVAQSKAFLPGIEIESENQKWSHWTDLDRSKIKPLLLKITEEQIIVNNSDINPFQRIPQKTDWRIFAMGFREYDLYYGDDKKPFGTEHEIIYLDKRDEKNYAYRYETGWYPTARTRLLIYECVGD